MKLSLESIKNIEAWEGYHLPEYNPEQIAFNTMVKPEWLHFGSGNIFRIFLGTAADDLIEAGLAREILDRRDPDRKISLHHLFRRFGNSSYRTVYRNLSANHINNSKQNA